MATHRPDRWQILRIDYNGEIIHKILGGWSGSYIYGDSWRLSSVIQEVTQKDDRIIFLMETGSTYECNPEMASMSLLMAGILSQIQETYPTQIITLEQLKK